MLIVCHAVTILHDTAKQKMISIIIVSYNTKKFILACLTSIRKYTPKGTEIIVVDNNSSDGSVAELETTTQNLKLIENKDNLGYAKAVNQGIKIVSGKYIFVLNPDTKFTKGVIEEMMQFVETTPNVGIVGPRLLNFDGSLQASCYHKPSVWAAIKEYFLGIKDSFDKYAPTTDRPVKVDAVVGAAMFMPRRTTEKAGLFNERYFMYFEDLDYCRKVRNAGLEIYYLPGAKVYHKHGGVTGSAGGQARRWLKDSSLVYHGLVGYAIITIILWLGQKWRKFLS